MIRWKRVPRMAQIMYISLPGDYFPLFLIMAIATTGVLMRYGGAFMEYLFKWDVLSVEVVQVKALAMGLVSFHPTIPEGIGTIFFIHLFLVSMLLAYFPFSKLVHMAGIFLSPTRNLSNNSRRVRHINPWDYPVKVHTYEEYEDEFRDKMIEAGLPVEKMPETPAEEPQETPAEEPQQTSAAGPQQTSAAGPQQTPTEETPKTEAKSKADSIEKEEKE